MDMSKQKERHGEGSSAGVKNIKIGVQTSRRIWRLQKVVSRRVCPCAFQRGSLTLEDFLGVAISALCGNGDALCFCDDRISGREIPDIDTARHKTLAVTVGQGADEGDPYTRLYAYDQVTLPFAAFSFGSRSGGAACSGQRHGLAILEKAFRETARYLSM